MESFESKFATFVDILKKTDATILTDKNTAVLKTALLAAKFDQIAGGVTMLRKKKKLNGYNLFMKERMNVLKETVTDSNKRMSQVSEEWKKLSEEEKTGWKDKATALSEVPTKLQVRIKDKTKSQKWSGYQIFVSENMAKLTGVTPKERMKTIGEQWKALPEEQKDAFKLKAEAKTAAAAQAAQAAQAKAQ